MTDPLGDLRASLKKRHTKTELRVAIEVCIAAGVLVGLFMLFSTGLPL